MTAQEHLDSVLAKGTSFEIGDYVSRGFNLFRKNMGAFVGFIFVYLGIILLVDLIPAIGSMVNRIYISPALLIGGALFCLELDTKEGAEFSKFFDGFRYVKQILPTYLVVGAIYVLIIIPLLYSIGIENITKFASGDVNAIMDVIDTMPRLLLLGTLLAFVIINSVFLYLGYFIAIYKLDFNDALKYGFLFGKSQMINIIFFSIILGLIAVLGLFLLIVGVFLTFAITIPMLYASFIDLTEYSSFVAKPIEEDYWTGE